MKQTLQKIIFPDRKICNIQDMFFRTKKEIYEEETEKIIFESNSTLDEVVSFNTYFNTFSFFKWEKYTKLNNLGFSFKFKGKVRLKFYSAKLFKDEIISEQLCNKIFESDSEKTEIIEFNFSEILKKSEIYFEIISYKEKTEIFDMEFFTNIDKMLLNDIKLGVGTCTYFKEQYIYKNFGLIKDTIDKYLSGENIKYYVIDNGNTIDENKLKDIKNLKVIYSKNMGASGGFSRVFFESIKEDDTHIISLDDDILINPYAIILTFRFLQMMKEEYLDYGIGGAMLILDKKYVQHDNGSYLEENKIFGMNAHIDLRNFENVLRNSFERYHNNIFNGFWFCCYPIKVLKNKGLAYPFFMKGDDVEIGVRIYNDKFITMNSICVWHEDFFKKFTPVYTNFYETRNLLIINSLIFEKYSFFEAYSLIFKRIMRELLFFRYDGCLLIYKAIDEFFKGSKAIIEKDNNQFVKENREIYKMESFNSLKHRVKKLSKIYDQEKHLKKTNKFFRILTFNGQLLPKIFQKKQVEVPIVVATFKSVERARKIVHYDLENEMGYITSLNKLKLLKNLFKLVIYYFIFLFRFKKAKNDFLSNRKDMVKLEFWEEKFKEE